VSQIEQPAGSTDHDVDTASQRIQLFVVTNATVDGQDASTQHGGCLGQVGTHLERELAGWRHHEGLRLAVELELLEVVLARQPEPLQQRRAEGEGLAGAGAGLTDEVGPGEGDRNRQFLDREGVGDSLVGQGLDDGSGDAELFEGGGGYVLGNDVSVSHIAVSRVRLYGGISGARNHATGNSNLCEPMRRLCAPDRGRDGPGR